jgi:hypothetical protein
MLLDHTFLTHNDLDIYVIHTSDYDYPFSRLDQ